ncbi:NrsF family protein [Jiella sp. M17.18]|uniref:NrsF family protein n=1 Tax=Jiella sp. M17.18 TaxID=3234247 RepID=UPI0034DF9CF5
MTTESLIDRLVADAEARPPETAPPWWLLGLIAPILALAVFLPTIGPRPDIAHSMTTMPFDMKFVDAGLLALSAFLALTALARPAAPIRHRLAWLALPACVLLVTVAAEMAVVPQSLWMTRAIGSNSQICMTAIPSMGAPVLILLLWGLKRRAPTRPTLTGAVAGLAAAGISAFFYAAHCTDDSPLFVATWYPMATLILVAAGALLGNRLLRW